MRAFGLFLAISARATSTILMNSFNAKTRGMVDKTISVWQRSRFESAGRQYPANGVLLLTALAIGVGVSIIAAFIFIHSKLPMKVARMVAFKS